MPNYVLGLPLQIHKLLQLLSLNNQTIMCMYICISYIQYEGNIIVITQVQGKAEDLDDNYNIAQVFWGIIVLYCIPLSLPQCMGRSKLKARYIW